MSILTKENSQSVTSFKASYLEVNYNEKKKTVEYKWIGHLKDQDAYKGFEKILEIVKKHGAQNLLADVTAFQGGSVQAAKWSNDVWSQQLADAGVKKLALNLPQSAFGEFSVKVSLGEKFVSVLKVEKFSSIEQAYAWIEKN